MEILLAILGVGRLVSLGGSGGSGGGFESEKPDLTDRGSPGPDLLTGTVFDDVIFGLAGNDTIRGDIGNDFLDGTGDDDAESLEGWEGAV
jgi:Ca2+-binding RTX toxin-like protein